MTGRPRDAKTATAAATDSAPGLESSGMHGSVEMVWCVQTMHTDCSRLAAIHWLAAPTPLPVLILRDVRSEISPLLSLLSLLSLTPITRTRTTDLSTDTCCAPVDGLARAGRALTHNHPAA